MKLSRYNANLSVRRGVVNRAAGPTRKKIAIVGFGDCDPREAPYDDPTWEVWGLNHAYRVGTMTVRYPGGRSEVHPGFMRDRFGDFRPDRWFELHQAHAQPPEDLVWIRTCPVPIYVVDTYPKSPTAVPYPLDAVLARWAPFGGDYFASSFAYMFALALTWDVKTIGLFGCDLDWGRERAVEHGNLAYWIGLARGLGVTVEIPKDSRLCRHYARYGIEYDQEKGAVEDRMARLILELLQDGIIRTKWSQLIDRWNAAYNHPNPDVLRQLREELWNRRAAST